MTPSEAPGSQHGRQKSVVVVNFPWGREFVWLSSDSPVSRTQAGEIVVFRDREWRVLRREERDDSLTLTLALA